MNYNNAIDEVASRLELDDATRQKDYQRLVSTLTQLKKEKRLPSLEQMLKVLAAMSNDKSRGPK